jgi:hypothetical protein
VASAERERGGEAEGHAEPERQAPDRDVGDGCRGEPHRADRGGGSEHGAHEAGEAVGRDGRAGDREQAGSEECADGRGEHAVPEYVVPAVPLQVPDHEAGPPEHLDPEDLGRPVRSLPVQGERDRGERGGEHHGPEIGHREGATAVRLGNR